MNELERHWWLWLPETLYFGGGTPSLIPVDFLREVMSTIPGAALTEVTLECAPGTVTPNSAEAWKE
ncbi:MAG: hypothetical protein JO097_07250, partial [Acidobacteriaceae bacterium]|nr:hypothetical protein [Acidobacteriaceae bacterium]